MSIVRQVGKYILSYEALQRMYIVIHKKKQSLWFDNNTKDDLCVMNDNDFVKECKRFIKNSLVD